MWRSLHELSKGFQKLFLLRLAVATLVRGLCPVSPCSETTDLNESLVILAQIPVTVCVANAISKASNGHK